MPFGAVSVETVAGTTGAEGAEEAARMSEAICKEGDKEAEAVREPSAFDCGPASVPAPGPGPTPDASPLVTGEAIAAGDEQASPWLKRNKE